MTSTVDKKLKEHASGLKLPQFGDPSIGGMKRDTSLLTMDPPKMGGKNASFKNKDKKGGYSLD